MNKRLVVIGVVLIAIALAILFFSRGDDPSVDQPQVQSAQQQCEESQEKARDLYDQLKDTLGQAVDQGVAGADSLYNDFKKTSMGSCVASGDAGQKVKELTAKATDFDYLAQQYEQLLDRIDTTAISTTFDQTKDKFKKLYTITVDKLGK